LYLFICKPNKNNKDTKQINIQNGESYEEENLFILSLFLSLFITSPAHALNLFGLVTGSEDAVGNNIDKWFNPFQSNITGAVLDVYLPIIMQLGGIIAAYAYCRNNVNSS
jgi:hypothetical protein